MTFQSDWSRAFAEALPLGYVLRASFPDYWTRFHALPDAQRLATSAAEQRAVLDRAHALGSACFDIGAPVWLVRCHFPGTPTPTSLPSCFSQYDPGCEATLDIQAKRTHWTETDHSDVFRAIMEDTDRLLFFCPANVRVFAPYDGGFDLFDPDPARRSALRMRFRDWASLRADGL